MKQEKLLIKGLLVIACIKDPLVIKKILDHLDKTATPEQKRLTQSRAPPQGSLFS